MAANDQLDGTDPESPSLEPLVETASMSSYRTLARDPALNKADEDEWDSTVYETEGMMSWAALFMWHGCAWDNTSIWKSMGVGMIAMIITCAFGYFYPDAVLVEPSQIVRFGSFLTGFVGLLLGFFLSSAMNRWFSCVSEFLTLLEAVRSMQMQMASLGVEQHRVQTLARYGTLSAWLLHLSLELESNDQADFLADTSGKVRREQVWKQLELLRPGLVKDDEKELLYSQGECYGLVWTFVATLIGQMSQDGEIPPVASPTFVRILGIVDDAYSSIREVRSLHMVKPPFIYIHTLAFLVHMNNIITSFSCGISLGLTKTRSMTSILADWMIHYALGLMYLALLELAVSIAQPFTHHHARIPAKRLIRKMERDLNSAAIIADNPPFWDRPDFKST